MPVDGAATVEADARPRGRQLPRRPRVGRGEEARRRRLRPDARAVALVLGARQSRRGARLGGPRPRVRDRSRAARSRLAARDRRHRSRCWKATRVRLRPAGRSRAVDASKPTTAAGSRPSGLSCGYGGAPLHGEDWAPAELAEVLAMFEELDDLWGRRNDPARDVPAQDGLLTATTAPATCSNGR